MGILVGIFGVVAWCFSMPHGRERPPIILIASVLCIVGSLLAMHYVR